jgi:hypothetical protein
VNLNLLIMRGCYDQCSGHDFKNMLIIMFVLGLLGFITMMFEN